MVDREWSILGMRAHAGRRSVPRMRRGRWCLLGLAAVALALLPPQQAKASTPLPPDPARSGCLPGQLCRTVTDRAAWDEWVTVTDRAAWDERVTVVDRPATSATRTVVDAPAYTVAHHDLVTPAWSYQERVLVAPAYTESYWAYVSSGYWTSSYVDTSHYDYVPGSWSYSPGYWAYSPGYWYWQAGSWQYQSGSWSWSCQWNSWWWWGWWSCGWSYSGGYWWYSPGSWAYQPGYWYYQPGSWSYSPGYWRWVASGYWTSRYVDTSHYELRTRYVPAVYDWVTRTVAAVYLDWTEWVPARTHVETYTVPAVTHVEIVHHPATTRLALVHHEATTHQEVIALSALVTRSRQSAAALAVGGTSAAATGAGAPADIDIPLALGAALAGGTGGSWSGGGWPGGAERDEWWAERSGRGAWDARGAAAGTLTSAGTAYLSAWASEAVRDDGIVTSGGGSPRGGGDPLGRLAELAFLAGLAALSKAGRSLGRAGGGGASAADTLVASRAASAFAEGASSASLEAGAPTVTRLLGDLGTPAAGDAVGSAARLARINALFPSFDSDTSAATDPVAPTSWNDPWAPGGARDESARAGRRQSATSDPGPDAGWSVDPLGFLKRAWDDGTGAARSAARDAAYSVADTGNAAATLARLGAYEAAQTGHTGAALARAGAYALAGSGDAAMALGRESTYGAAGLVGRLGDAAERTAIGRAARTFETGVRLVDALASPRRTQEQEDQLAAARDALYRAGPALDAADSAALDGINAGLKWAATPVGEGLRALLTVGAESTYDVNGTTVVNNAGGLGRAVAWTAGFVGEWLGGRSPKDASDLAGSNTITLGSRLIVSNTTIEKGSPLLAHELGHVPQADYLGPMYLPAYLLTLTGSHDTHPAEVNANKQAGLDEHGKPPADWKYPWPYGDKERPDPRWEPGGSLDESTRAARRASALLPPDEDDQVDGVPPYAPPMPLGAGPY